MFTITLTVSLLLSVVVFNNYGIYGNSIDELKVKNNDCVDDEGVWWPILEEWTTAVSHRKGRIMMATLSNRYVIQERSDQFINDTVESKISPGNKIINNNSYNNNKKPPMRQISDTDMYLLGAIEKMVYKVDFMEKRLRRVEEMLYYVMAGNRVDTEPCADNFTRIGSHCYYFNGDAGREYDWKTASKLCKKLGGFLAEMETIEESQDLITYIQSYQQLRGKDFWLGGLNPGLIWIWSNSGRPVAIPGSQNNRTTVIQGEGRCLKLAYNPALRTYGYKGTDCSIRFNYICETPENSSSNEITRLGKARNILKDDL